MLFMIHKTILYKDGKGITLKVTYLGPDLSDGISNHKIRTWNDADFFVNGIPLSSLDAPDIGTVPVSVEQWAVELPKLAHLQLEQISNLWILDHDQRKFMELQYKMNHLPLQEMITLAKKRRIGSLPNSNILFLRACLAFLVQHIINLGVPKAPVAQFEKKVMMLLENAFAWIN
jgi:hypothetical protein